MAAPTTWIFRSWGDNEISRRNHAVIVFDPKKKETVLLPGDANGIVYLNGNAVYAPATLNKYDEIELGKSKFLFVPLLRRELYVGRKDRVTLEGGKAYDAANNPDPPVRRRSGPAAHPAVHRRQRQAVTQPPMWEAP